MVNESVLLTRASLLSALLFSMHVVSDLVLGLDRVGPQNLGLSAILLVWVYVTLMYAERRWGQVIILFVCLAAAAMPVLHMRSLNSDFVKQDGAWLFLWALFAICTSGAFGAILALRALLRRKA